MKWLRILGLVIGIGLLLYGGGAIAYSFIAPVKTTMGWYIGVLLTTGSGLAVVATSIIVPLLNKNSDKTDYWIQKEENMAKNIIVPEKVELDAKKLADYECLNHLTTRLKGVKDEEGIELCRKLQDRLFNLYYGSPTPKENSTVS